MPKHAIRKDPLVFLPGCSPLASDARLRARTLLACRSHLLCRARNVVALLRGGRNELFADNTSPCGTYCAVHGHWISFWRGERRFAGLLLAAGVNFLAYWNADNLVLMMHGAQEVDAGDRTRSMRACAPPSISCWIAHAARLPHGQSSAKRVRDRSQSRPRSRCSDDLDPDEFRKRRSAPQGCQLEG